MRKARAYFRVVGSNVGPPLAKAALVASDNTTGPPPTSRCARKSPLARFPLARHEKYSLFLGMVFARRLTSLLILCPLLLIPSHVFAAKARAKSKEAAPAATAPAYKGAVIMDAAT